MPQRPNGVITGTASGMQTVFRVKGTKAREKPVSDLVVTPKNTFNARRSHKKSRTGCQNCKLRRVKCDENRVGGCLKCRNHGIDCDYICGGETNSRSMTMRTNLSPMSSTFTASQPSSAAMTPVTVEMVQLLPGLDPPTPLEYDLPANITPYWETLCHFERFTCQTVTSPDGVKLFESSILAVANQSDFLMHAVLGTAAAHLAWKAKLRNSPIECRRHQQAEAYHWQRAIAKFSSTLGFLDQITAEKVDALISTCMLLGIHSYFLSDHRGDTSFVWSPEDERSEALRWLSIQSGFGLLLRTLGEKAALSVWLEVFNSAGQERSRFRGDLESADGIFRDLLDICAINQNSTPGNNPYLLVVQELFALLQAGPQSMTNFARLMAFMGRLVGPFQELLVQRDRAAMLVVAYWLTLMHELQLWWIQDRARRECCAIIEYLRKADDPRVRRLLEFPASIMKIHLFDAT